MRYRDKILATAESKEKTIIGIGYYASERIGATALKARAIKLHHPIEVAANITGNSEVCAIYTVANEQEIPNLAARIMTRKASLVYSPYPPTAITTPAIEAIIKHEDKLLLVPIVENKIPAASFAIISLICAVITTEYAFLKWLAV